MIKDTQSICKCEISLVIQLQLRFQGIFRRFSKDIIDRLKRCPLVQEITEDIMFNALDFEIQEDAPRHLARISRRRRMKPNKPYPYMYETEYLGQGVNAYVIDSGIEVDHPEFEGRASAGYDFTEEGSEIIMDMELM